MRGVLYQLSVFASLVIRGASLSAGEDPDDGQAVHRREADAAQSGPADLSVRYRLGPLTLRRRRGA
jgi:hypothetical protein